MGVDVKCVQARIEQLENTLQEEKKSHEERLGEMTREKAEMEERSVGLIFQTGCEIVEVLLT